MSCYRSNRRIWNWVGCLLVMPSLRSSTGATNDRGPNNTTANVYFSSRLNRQGALRAVLSSKEGVSLLEKSSNSYAGHNFPTEFNGRPEFAILRVFDGEANKEWRSGYYLFDQDIIQVEEAPDGP